MTKEIFEHAIVAKERSDNMVYIVHNFKHPKNEADLDDALKIMFFGKRSDYSDNEIEKFQDLKNLLCEAIEYYREQLDSDFDDFFEDENESDKGTCLGYIKPGGLRCDAYDS